MQLRLKITTAATHGLTGVLVFLTTACSCYAQEAGYAPEEPKATIPFRDRALIVEAGGLGGIYAIGYESEVLHSGSVSWITTLGGTASGHNNKTGIGIMAETGLLCFSGNRKQAFEWGFGALFAWNTGIGYLTDNNNIFRKSFSPAYSMKIGSRLYFLHHRMLLKFAFMPFISQYYDINSGAAPEQYKWKLYPGGSFGIGYCF